MGTPTRANITHVIPRISKLDWAGAEQRTFFKAAINNSDVLETMMEHYSQHTRSLAILVINTSQWTSSIKKAIFKSDFVIMTYNGEWAVNYLRKVNIATILRWAWDNENEAKSCLTRQTSQLMRRGLSWEMDETDGCDLLVVREDGQYALTPGN